MILQFGCSKSDMIRKIHARASCIAILLLKSRLKINAEPVLEDVEFKNFLRRPTMVGDIFRHSLIFFTKVGRPDAVI